MNSKVFAISVEVRIFDNLVSVEEVKNIYKTIRGSVLHNQFANGVEQLFSVQNQTLRGEEILDFLTDLEQSGLIDMSEYRGMKFLPIRDLLDVRKNLRTKPEFGSEEESKYIDLLEKAGYEVRYRRS